MAVSQTSRFLVLAPQFGSLALSQLNLKRRPQFEDILHRPIMPLRPEMMPPLLGVDQLRGNPHPMPPRRTLPSST
jgi:hypothetical protein